MKQIELNNKKLLIVPVPKDAYDFDIVLKERMYVIFRRPDKIQEINTGCSTLKKYKIISTLSNISEEWCASVVEPESGIPEEGYYGYKDYTREEWCYVLDTAKESFKSKLKAEGIDINQEQLIIEIL